MGKQTQQGAQADVAILRDVTRSPHKIDKAAMREASEEQPGANYGVPPKENVLLLRREAHGELWIMCLQCGENQ